MRFNNPIFIFLLAVFFTLSQTACKKDKFLPSGGNLSFSTDTLTFDTVFTSLGSFTNEVKIYNKQGQKVNISSIRVEGENANLFHLNVNGIKGNAVSNVEVAANDSIYVFATVNIDPTAANLPFIVQAKLVANLNGKEFSMPLIAYGQNAYYIVDSVLQTQTWKTDKPYVIMHNALVDSNATLTIPAGCRIYMHADSRLYVKGTLNAIGTKQDSIVFQGDRLDRKYFGNKGYPGEWGGIYFFRYSHNNIMDYVVLKNCGNNAGVGLPSAIQLEPDLLADGVPQLTLKHSIIENSIGHGILSFQGSLKAENCLINSCGAQALAIIQGGEYDISNCTFVIMPIDNRLEHTKEPAVAILNYFNQGNNSFVVGDLNAVLRNCIVWGSLEDELVIDKLDDAKATVKLENCAVKTKEIPSFVTNINSMVNTDPQFVDYTKWDFHLKETSPLIDAGVPAVLDDLDGKPRAGNIDIGCYER